MTHGEKWDQVEREYADYVAVMKRMTRPQSTWYGGPHCDNYVLHVPNACDFCGLEEYQALHVARMQMKIAHTGEPVPAGWRCCPAERFRNAATIHRWGGNQPKKEGEAWT